MALETVRNIVKSKSVVVVGSAPLSQLDHQHITEAQVIVCVNGAIGSITHNPDIWVVNSREYDDDLWNDPTRWTPERKLLHAAMLHQAANKHIRHVVFIKKAPTSIQTIEKLKAQHTSWRAQTEIKHALKVQIGLKAGIRNPGTAFNVSAGLWSTCLILGMKPSQVRLVGFSFHNNYSYLADAPPDTRKHIAQDQEALAQILTTHPQLIVDL